jgi:hypothetical protein
MTKGVPLLQMNAGHVILASRLVVNVDKSFDYKPNEKIRFL